MVPPGYTTGNISKDRRGHLVPRASLGYKTPWDSQHGGASSRRQMDRGEVTGDGGAVQTSTSRRRRSTNHAIVVLGRALSTNPR